MVILTWSDYSKLLHIYYNGGVPFNETSNCANIMQSIIPTEPCKKELLSHLVKDPQKLAMHAWLEKFNTTCEYDFDEINKHMDDLINGLKKEQIIDNEKLYISIDDYNMRTWVDVFACTPTGPNADFIISETVQIHNPNTIMTTTIRHMYAPNKETKDAMRSFYWPSVTKSSNSASRVTLDDYMQQQVLPISCQVFQGVHRKSASSTGDTHALQAEVTRLKRELNRLQTSCLLPDPLLRAVATNCSVVTATDRNFLLQQIQHMESMLESKCDKTMLVNEISNMRELLEAFKIRQINAPKVDTVNIAVQQLRDLQQKAQSDPTLALEITKLENRVQKGVDEIDNKFSAYKRVSASDIYINLSVFKGLVQNLDLIKQRSDQHSSISIESLDLNTSIPQADKQLCWIHSADNHFNNIYQLKRCASHTNTYTDPTAHDVQKETTQMLRDVLKLSSQETISHVICPKFSFDSQTGNLSLLIDKMDLLSDDVVDYETVSKPPYGFVYVTRPQGYLELTIRVMAGIQYFNIRAKEQRKAVEKVRLQTKTKHRKRY